MYGTKHRKGRLSDGEDYELEVHLPLAVVFDDEIERDVSRLFVFAFNQSHQLQWAITPDDWVRCYRMKSPPFLSAGCV